MYNNKKKLYYEADYFIHCIHIYYNDVFFCTRSPLLSNNQGKRSPISPMVLFSQKITGVVYTEGGKEVLIGASVIEVGSTNGTITDIDGEYSIGISKADKKILQASYLGYETKQERIGGRRVVNFFLKESSQALDK